MFKYLIIKNNNKQIKILENRDFDDSSASYLNNLLFSKPKDEKNKKLFLDDSSKEQNNKFVIKKSPQIFTIKKVLKLGRPRKNSSKKRKHNKFKLDNVIRKFKAKLIQNIYNYLNISFKRNQDNINNNKRIINIIQKINSKITKSISKSDNIKWLNTKISEVFSYNVSSKYVFYESNYNKKLIERILDKKEEVKVIEVLEKTVREMWIIYKNDDVNNEFPGLNTIKDDIEKFREMKESEDYIELYCYACNKFEDIFVNIKPKIKLNKKNK